ncbi:ABC transporter permease [[Mycoplasma] anseris]|uniref:ABC transporter permease n=1 Tax=[Mycoplasma] anseris TaxID=92400 RepID=A0A2Z4NCF1_9BACT|nr:ABC transporter permease [[Mycoplasma] anseris]AWX69165.1 ABC transporter permease [[Mycoplasma] anseris]
MKNPVINYSNFLFKTTFKKKNSFIIPIIFILINICLVISLSIIKMDVKYHPIVVYSLIFFDLLLTIAYASLKALNIFKDIEAEGLEILIFSKPITRKNIISAKVLAFIEFALMWSAITFICNLLLVLITKIHNSIVLFSFFSFVAIFFAFVIFGSITSIIAFKLNQKMAMTVPLIMFMPLALGGSFISANSTSTNDNLAFYLNTKYPYHHSNKEVDAEMFYLNNNEDKFYLMPNGFNKKGFDQSQELYLKKALEFSKQSSYSWQAYSWSILPYQMIDIFNQDDTNIFSLLTEQKENNLANYLYYPKKESITYTYKINKTPKFLTSFKNPNTNEVEYIVPSLLKNHSFISPTPINSNVIYAREGADDETNSFPEDYFIYANPNNLVGNLKWELIADVLKNEDFDQLSNLFFNKIKIELAKQNINSDIEAKNYIINTISKEINNENSDFYKINEPNIALFDKNAVKNKNLSSEIERKIYLAVTLIYYLYFKQTADQNIDLLNKILINDNPKLEYQPSQIKIQVENYNYFIGGYEYFAPKQIIRNDKVIIRYQLKSNDNYLFSTTNQLYSVERDKKIVNKHYYLIIWLAFAGLLLFLNAWLYARKDYK